VRLVWKWSLVILWVQYLVHSRLNQSVCGVGEQMQHYRSASSEDRNRISKEASSSQLVLNLRLAALAQPIHIPCIRGLRGSSGTSTHLTPHPSPSSSDLNAINEGEQFKRHMSNEDQEWDVCLLLPQWDTCHEHNKILGEGSCALLP
jgi:hypothetical protein